MNEKTFRAAHAHKLDDLRRREWLPPADVLNALPPLRSKTIADIGAGTGYFTLPMTQLTSGPNVIYALDIQPEMLSLLQNKLSADAADKVHLIEGSAAHTTLPDASCDLLLLANVRHELDDTPAVLRECRRILRNQGTLAILDWRPDVDPDFGPPLEHRIAPDAVCQELKENAGRAFRQQSIGRYSYLILTQFHASPPLREGSPNA
jgi:ubiquinone/menaquinone biosynthesis C-methylase UbiE